MDFRWEVFLLCSLGTWLLSAWSFSSGQSLNHVWLFATPWTAACQASLSITNSWSLLKLMSVESVMPSNHLILCGPPLLLLQSFPASGSFPMSQFFASGGQSIGASSSVLPVNIRDWFPLGKGSITGNASSSARHPEDLRRPSAFPWTLDHTRVGLGIKTWRKSHV